MTRADSLRERRRGFRNDSGRTHPLDPGAAGVAGWLEAGEGQSVAVLCAAGGYDAPGDSAVVIGGVGGDIVRFGVGYLDLGHVYAFRAIAGRGGDASVHAGGGGIGRGHRNRGGDAIAYGGRGGSAHDPLSPVRSLGGRGGDAKAIAGQGGDGQDHCDPMEMGERGAEGGDAEAYGGDAGATSFASGRGGDAASMAGDGGQGGDGAPPGRGGREGLGQAVAGSAEEVRGDEGQAGHAGVVSGVRGASGNRVRG